MNMDKWYVESGDIKETVTADDAFDACKKGIRKGLDRYRVAWYMAHGRCSEREEENIVGLVVSASSKGFPSVLEDLADRDTLHDTISFEVLRQIGEIELADAMEAYIEQVISGQTVLDSDEEEG